MKIKKIFINVILVLVILITTMPVLNIVSADDPTGQGDDPDYFWKSAGGWFAEVQDKGENNVSPISIKVVNQFMDMVNYIGTVVIIIATMFLGVKYMFGSVEGKADVKESMITLLVACLFFFGWQYIRDIILYDGTNLFISSTTDTSYKYIFARLLGVVTMIVKVAAIAGVIYVGVRYIFSGASGRADLKDKSVYFIIGIILTFCSVTVLTIVSNAIADLLG